MSIRDWHESDQPREKLLHLGANKLSDGELLAIFLRVGAPGKSALDLAHDLLKHYSDFRYLLDATAEDFCAQYGMGIAKYAQLQATLEITKRYLACKISKQDVIKDPADTVTFLRHQLRHKTNEVFAGLFLDNKHQVIKFEELFEGSIDNSHIYPRTIVKRALAHNASAIIFSHNHPSGDPEPSESDIQLTRRLHRLLSEIDIRVLDHVIIGDKTTTSLKQMGLF